jgi:arylsulfatase A-like enzyme
MRMSRSLIPPVLLASIAIGLQACGDSGGDADKFAGTSSGLPNVLLISIDTLRADHMSAYGYERATTPNLADLANEGARFLAAYAPTATTGPSHASLFTSLYPPTHRVIKNGRTLGGDHETLAEVLARWGYRCGAAVSSYVLNHKFGFQQGFHHWDDDLSRADVRVTTRAVDGVKTDGKYYGQADDTTRRALSWLEGRGSSAREPFFLFVHYYDPHYPYEAPAPFADRFASGEFGEPTDRDDSGLERTIAAYDGEIAFADHEVGRLLAALDSLGLAEQTLVVVTSDHGEGLKRHGHMHHGIHIYEEAVHVPLILRWPGRIAAGASVATPVALTDVAPTILELVRGEGDSSALDAELGDLLSEQRRPSQAPAAERGHSLVPLLSGGSEGVGTSAPVFFYRRHYEGSKVSGEWVEGERFGVRQGRWKYLRGDGPKGEELYDLESDPMERKNLFSKRPEVAGPLSQRLDVWHRSVLREDSEQADLSPDDRAKLKALGYVD